MKQFFALVILLMITACAEAQYRKPAKSKPIPAPRVVVVRPPVRPLVVPSPYVQLMQAYQFEQFRMQQQFMYEQQRLRYLQMLELQRQQMYRPY